MTDKPEFNPSAEQIGAHKHYLSTQPEKNPKPDALQRLKHDYASLEIHAEVMENRWKAAEARIAELEAQLAEINVWLKEYAIHPRRCPKAMFPTNKKEVYKCTCGLQAILEKGK